MTTTTDPVALATTDLAALAPGLLPGFVAALPHATDVVDRRLLSAAYREDLAGARSGAIWAADPDRVTLPSGVHRAARHGFDQIGLLDPVPVSPDRLLVELNIASPELAAELVDARVNLAAGVRPAGRNRRAATGNRRTDGRGGAGRRAR